VTWQALHVYAFSGQDALVTGALRDWLRLDDAEPPRSFFIRYWHGGPHLRLRFETADDLSAVRARITADLAAHQAEHPFDERAFLAAQEAYATLEGVEAGPDIVPDLSVVDAAYEPEYGKYGGRRGVEIAEEVFVASTRVVLADRGRDPGGEPAGRELATLFTALYASGMGEEEMLRFLQYYSGLWSGYVALPEWMKWESRIEDTRPEVFDRIGEILHGSGPGESLAHWAETVDRSLTAVRAELSTVGAEIEKMDPLTDSPIHHLLGHYLHTHFNRVGVSADEESFLGHLGYAALRRLSR